MFENEFENENDFSDEDIREIALKFLRVSRETPNAWLVEFEISTDLEPVEAWLPKSRCAIRENTIFVPDWLVEEKSLWEYEID